MRYWALGAKRCCSAMKGDTLGIYVAFVQSHVDGRALESKTGWPMVSVAYIQQELSASQVTEVIFPVATS
jgi:hypothetical protein